MYGRSHITRVVRRAPFTSICARRVSVPSIRSYRASNPVSSIALAKPTSCLPIYSSAVQQLRRTMFIQTATTPNSDALQFIPGVSVLGSDGAANNMRTIEYNSPREGLKSPLATRLFAIEGVKGIMYGSDFVTVRKDTDHPWQLMKPDIYAAIMDHFSSGRALIREDSSDSSSTGVAEEEDSEIVSEIKELLESRVRPSIQEDGGDLDFVSFDEATGVVKIRLRGACRGCSSSTVTLKHGVEGMLTYYIPEVTSVESVEDELETQANKEFSKLEAQLVGKTSANN